MRMTEAAKIVADDDTNRSKPSDNDELDAELALLAHAAEDLGTPTETLDVATLTDTEKRLLIALMRERLHLPSPQRPHEHDLEHHEVKAEYGTEPTSSQHRGTDGNA